MTTPATIAATLRPHDHLHFTVPSQTLRGQSWTITPFDTLDAAKAAAEQLIREGWS